MLATINVNAGSDTCRFALSATLCFTACLSDGQLRPYGYLESGRLGGSDLLRLNGLL